MPVLTNAAGGGGYSGPECNVGTMWDGIWVPEEGCHEGQHCSHGRCLPPLPGEYDGLGSGISWDTCGSNPADATHVGIHLTKSGYVDVDFNFSLAGFLYSVNLIWASSSLGSVDPALLLLGIGLVPGRSLIVALGSALATGALLGLLFDELIDISIIAATGETGNPECIL